MCMNGTTENVASKINNTWWMLKVTYGLVPIVLGIDKLGIGFITSWTKYVAPQIAALLPISVPHFVYLVGIIEIIAGLIVLSHWTKWGAYIVIAWLGVIVVNLLMIGGLVDIAARDIVIAIGAIALVQLTDIKNSL